MSAEVIDLSSEREKRDPNTPAIPMALMTSTDWECGWCEYGGEHYVVFHRADGKGGGVAMTEGEARQFSRQLIDAANALRQQRIREGAPE